MPTKDQITQLNKAREVHLEKINEQEVQLVKQPDGTVVSIRFRTNPGWTDIRSSYKNNENIKLNEKLKYDWVLRHDMRVIMGVEYCLKDNGSMNSDYFTTTTVDDNILFGKKYKKYIEDTASFLFKDKLLKSGHPTLLTFKNFRACYIGGELKCRGGVWQISNESGRYGIPNEIAMHPDDGPAMKRLGPQMAAIHQLLLYVRNEFLTCFPRQQFDITAVHNVSVITWQTFFDELKAAVKRYDEDRTQFSFSKIKIRKKSQGSRAIAAYLKKALEKTGRSEIFKIQAIYSIVRYFVNPAPEVSVHQQLQEISTQILATPDLPVQSRAGHTLLQSLSKVSRKVSW